MGWHIDAHTDNGTRGMPPLLWMDSTTAVAKWTGVSVPAAIDHGNSFMPHVTSGATTNPGTIQGSILEPRNVFVNRNLFGASDFFLPPEMVLHCSEPGMLAAARV